MKSWIISHASTLLIALMAVIAPIKPLLLTTGFLVCADFVFGVYKAFKLGEKITSRKMGNTISKLLLYNLMIISVYFLNHYIICSKLPLEKIAAGFLTLTEIKSIDESFTALFGWSIWTKLKKVLNRGTSTTKDLMKDFEDKK